jgi:hypothetical protein
VGVGWCEQRAGQPTVCIVQAACPKVQGEVAPGPWAPQPVGSGHSGAQAPCDVWHALCAGALAASPVGGCSLCPPLEVVCAADMGGK